MPNTAPAVIEKHKGIIIIVKTTAIKSSRLDQLILRILFIIIIPTSISIGEVAELGIKLIIGDRNKNGIHKIAVQTADKPVLAPVWIAAELSTKITPGEVPIKLLTMPDIASEINDFL